MGNALTGRRPIANPRPPTGAAAVPPRLELDVLRFCLCGLTILGISRIHQRYAILAVLRPGLLLAVVAVAAAFLRPKALADKAWMRRWPTRIVMGLTVATLGSIAFGISQGGAFYYFVEYYSKVLILAFLLAAAIRHARDLRLFVWAYVIGTALLVYMALFVFEMRTEWNGVIRLANLDTWDANDICVLLMIGLAFCLLLIRTSRGLGRAVAATILVGIGAAIARSGSRGGFLGLAAVALMYLLSLQGTSVARRVLMVAGIFIGIGVAAPKGYWTQMNTITSADEDYNWDADQGRRKLAIHGIQYMMSYPVFGIGLNQFGRAESTLSERARTWDPSQAGIKESAAHNSYVQAGAELGIPGLLLFATLVLGTIVVPWRTRKRIPPAWEKGTWEQQFLFQMARYLPLASVGFAVTSFFVSFAYQDPIYLLAAMTGALTASVNQALGKAPNAPVALASYQRSNAPIAGGFRRGPVARRYMPHEAGARRGPPPPSSPPTPR